MASEPLLRKLGTWRALAYLVVAAAVASANNYVSAALASAMRGQPIAVASTRPYGCSVKYAE
jgi:hypothetical protein